MINLKRKNFKNICFVAEYSPNVGSIFVLQVEIDKLGVRTFNTSKKLYTEEETDVDTEEELEFIARTESEMACGHMTDRMRFLKETGSLPSGRPPSDITEDSNWTDTDVEPEYLVRLGEVGARLRRDTSNRRTAELLNDPDLKIEGYSRNVHPDKQIRYFSRLLDLADKYDRLCESDDRLFHTRYYTKGVLEPIETKRIQAQREQDAK